MDQQPNKSPESKPELPPNIMSKKPAPDPVQMDRSDFHEPMRELEDFDKALELTPEEAAALAGNKKPQNKGLVKKILRSYNHDQQRILQATQMSIARFQRNLVEQVNLAVNKVEKKNLEMYSGLVRHLVLPFEERILSCELHVAAMKDIVIQEFFERVVEHSEDGEVSSNAIKAYSDRFDAKLKKRIDELGVELVEKKKKQLEEQQKAAQEAAVAAKKKPEDKGVKADGKLKAVSSDKSEGSDEAKPKS